MTEEEKNKNKKGTISSTLVFLALLLFGIQNFRFIKEEGYTHHIISSLFKMTVILGLIILIVHQKDSEKGKNSVIKLTRSEQYFNAIK